MKKILLLLLICLFFIPSFGQVPQAFSYQAVAYDSKGLPIKTPISLKISILDNSDKGAVVYAETHKKVQPDENGLYSLNIGQGKPETNKDASKGDSDTYLFSKIKWGTNKKFIKIEMDPSGDGTGTNYILVGTNQLMSVPYALFALSTMSTTGNMNTVNNIQELRDYCFNPALQPDTTVYVKGHDLPSDGGGGVFIYKTKTDMAAPYVYAGTPIPADLYPLDDDGIFISSNCGEEDGNLSTLGIWVRQFDGEVDMRYYGISGNWYGIDVTAKIQAAIDYAAHSVSNVNLRYGFNRTNTVFIPNGNYGVKQLVLKSGVRLRGGSREYTVISPSPESIDGEPLIIIDQGLGMAGNYAVTDVHVSDIGFWGDLKWKKPCFYISGKTGAGGSGLWNSSFKNIQIQNFKGDGMCFVGGGGPASGDVEYEKLNQFLTFENVTIRSVGDIEKENPYHALSIGGINEQFTFNNCSFYGGPDTHDPKTGELTYVVSGINVYIGVLKEGDTMTPNLINFDTCTFEIGLMGVYIESSNGININRCWFERLDRAVTVKGSYKKSKGINIMNSLFGAAAGYRDDEVYDNNGSVITYSNSQINVMNNTCGNYGLNNEKVNFIAGEADSSGRPMPNLGANTFGNSFVDYVETDSVHDDQDQRFSYGVDKLIDDALMPGGTILTENAKLIILSTSSEIKTIDKIISLVSAGELICIRVDKGKVRFNESNNIYLGYMADPDPTTSHPHGQLTINQGGFALFVKSDDGNYRETYNLISYKNRE